MSGRLHLLGSTTIMANRFQNYALEKSSNLLSDTELENVIRYTHLRKLKSKAVLGISFCGSDVPHGSVGAQVLSWLQLSACACPEERISSSTEVPVIHTRHLDSVPHIQI